MADVKILVRGRKNQYYMGRPAGGICSSVLIIDGSRKVLVDPGGLTASRRLVPSQLAALGIKPGDIDMLINTHLHFDHCESNYLFRGKPLVVHEKSIEQAKKDYWPEFVQACVDIMDVKKVSSDTKLSDDIELVETFGHTSGDLSVVVKTEEGIVVIAGDAITDKEDYLRGEPDPDLHVTDKVIWKESLERIIRLSPKMIIPGHGQEFKM